MTTSTSRKNIRSYLYNLLRQLSGTGQPLANVYKSQILDFGGLSPVAVISSNGAEPVRFTFEGFRPVYYFNLFIFVVYTRPPSWTEENAEDALDDIFEAIYNLFQNNQKSPYWESLTISSRTTTDSVEVSNVDYRREVFEIRVE